MKLLNFNFNGFNIKLFVVILVIYIIIFGNAACSCMSNGKESMANYNDNTYKVKSNFNLPTKKDVESRKSQPVPFAKNGMLMFKDTKFSPDCCPNAYSTSTGCACMTETQNNYLRARGSTIGFPEY